MSALLPGPSSPSQAYTYVARGTLKEGVAQEKLLKLTYAAKNVGAAHFGEHLALTKVASSPLAIIPH